MRELIERYRNAVDRCEKAAIWMEIENTVDEITDEHNPDEYMGSLYYDEDYHEQLNIETEAYKRGYMQAINDIISE